MQREAKQTSRSKWPSWRIYRVWGPRHDYVGIVEAVDKESALQIAFYKFQITNPEHQRRLLAEPRD
jgi:1,2-phenylacetyl-CoA epoxidase PaaB subunit